MAFGARPSNTRTREESDAQVAQSLVAALGILKAEPLRITHVRDGSDFLMSGPGVSPFGAGGTGGEGGFGRPPSGGGGGGGGLSEAGIDGEDGDPGEQGEQGPQGIPGPQGPPGGNGPPGPAGPQGPQGPAGADGSITGYIEFVSNVSYDTSDQCLKQEITRVYGFFAGGTGGTEFGVVDRTDNITCAAECD